MDLTGWGLSALGDAARKGEGMTMENRTTGRARLLVAGVGGGGTNAANRMIDAGVRGVEYVALNTDAQALEHAKAETRVQLGAKATRGLGAGGDPAIGAKAAEESYAELRQVFTGADLVFLTAGMGGGTGTGASPIVAQAAREQGALTIGIVTTPFAFERRRHGIAEQGILALREGVDALIVIPNERLMQLAARETGAFEAYRLADEVLRMGVQGISDLITVPGLINLDFADIRAVLADAGSAYLATAQASGDNRAELVARGALTNPLLDGDITGARGLVFNVTGGDDLTMHEVGRIAEMLSNAAHPDANIIFGTVYEPACEGKLKLTVVATGFAAGGGEGLRQPWISARVAPSHGRTEAAAPDPTRLPTAPSWPAIEPHPTPPLAGTGNLMEGAPAGTSAMPELAGPPIERRDTQPNTRTIGPAPRGEAGPAPQDGAQYPAAGQGYYAAASSAGYPAQQSGQMHVAGEAFAGEQLTQHNAEGERPKSRWGRLFGR